MAEGGALIPAFLLLCSAALMALHVRCWRKTQQAELDARELDFRRRQFRRRMQTSAMLGLLAVALFVGRLITGPLWLVLIFWGGVLLVVCWMGLLAAVDVLATKYHFGRLRQDHLVEQAKLQAQLHRARTDGKVEDEG